MTEESVTVSKAEVTELLRLFGELHQIVRGED